MFPIFLLPTGPCRQMCVVKVNRVESDSLGFSTKRPSHNSPCSTFPSSAAPAKNDLKAETDTHFDPQRLSGSEVTSRIPEGLRQCPQATQMHPGINESRCHSAEPQDLTTLQDCSIRAPPSEANRLSSPFHKPSTSDQTEMSLCPPDCEAQVPGSSCKEGTLSTHRNTDSCMDTGSETDTKNAAKADNMNTGVDPKCPHSSAEALYDVKTEPSDEKDSSPLTGHFYSSEKSSTEGSLFPPLLKRNAVDMPQLTPEPADKVGICPLPPVLTQEMPSLTPADDVLNEVTKTRLCSEQVAPVLERETPTGSLSSCGARQDESGSDLLMLRDPITVKLANIKHSDSSFNSERTSMSVSVSVSEGNTAHLTTNAMHKMTSGGVHEMPIAAGTAAEKDHTKLENVTNGQTEASFRQLVQSTSSGTEQQYSLAELANRDNSKDPAQRNSASSQSSAVSLLTSSSNNNPPAPSPLVCTQNDSHSASELYHNTTYFPSHCTSQNSYIEPKPFSSSIWKNLNSQSPAVLIQSLNPELPSDFTHDALPYTMWTEPQCKEVTDLDDPQQDLRESDKEEEGGTLTWAQLEPTSLVSVGVVEPMGICGDYELHRGEAEGPETLSLCRELERQRDAEESLHSDASVSPLGVGAGGQDSVSDMEEGGSDGEAVEQQCNAKRGSSSESSDEEEEEENNISNYESDELGLEPGEVCAVSDLLHSIIHIQSSSSTFIQLEVFIFTLMFLIDVCSQVPSTVSEEDDEELATPTQETYSTGCSHCCQTASCQR